MPRLEDYQRGVPLNEELRRLRAGVLDVAEAEEAESAAWEPDNVNRPLTEEEREDLATMTQQPGWKVLERLRKRTLQRMEKAAMLASETNPLGRAQEIAVGWANLAAFREQMRLDRAAVENEIQGLGTKGPGTDHASVLD